MDDICPPITISLNEDKFPRLDLPEDLEDVTVKMIKNALTEYMIMAWGMYCFFDTFLVNNLTRARTAFRIFYSGSLDVSQVSAIEAVR